MDKLPNESYGDYFQRTYKGKELEDWNFDEDKVIYDFSDGSIVTLDRDLYWEFCKETEKYYQQIDVDDFIPYTPTEQEYEKDEYEFFDNYFNEKNKP